MRREATLAQQKLEEAESSRISRLGCQKLSTSLRLRQSLLLPPSLLLLPCLIMLNPSKWCKNNIYASYVLLQFYRRAPRLQDLTKKEGEAKATYLKNRNQAQNYQHSSCLSPVTSVKIQARGHDQPRKHALHIVWHNASGRKTSPCGARFM